MISFEDYKFDVCPVCEEEVWPGDQSFGQETYYTTNECEHCGAIWTTCYILDSVNVYPSGFDGSVEILIKKKEPRYAKVYWTVEDVMDSVVDNLQYEDEMEDDEKEEIIAKWTEERCHAFLKKHQESISEAMCRAGNELLEELVFSAEEGGIRNGMG